MNAEASNAPNSDPEMPVGDAADTALVPAWRSRLGSLAATDARVVSIRAAAIALVAVGVALRLVQYAHDDSLWLDEAFLALNVQAHGFGSLFGQLDYNQGAPPGYLFLEKLVSVVWNDSELSLRLVAFVAGVTSVPLFYAAARRALAPWAAVLALAVFALLTPLAQHGAEVKPYSSDVFVSVALLFLVTGFASSRRLDIRRAAVAAIVAAAAVWLSFPAIFLVAGFAAVLVGEALWRRDLPRLRTLLAVGAIGLASFLVLLTTIVSRATSELQASFQGGSDSSGSPFYLPFPPRSLGDLHWFASATRSFVTTSVGFPRWAVVGVALLALAGAIDLLRRRTRTAFLLLAPLVFLLAASALHKYPFGGRFTLFYAPDVLVLVAAGAAAAIRAVVRLAPARTRAAATVVAAAALLAFLAVPAQRSFNLVAHHRGREQVKPALAYLDAHWRKGDVLYVYYAAQYALRYYDGCRSCDALDRRGRARTLWSSIRLAHPGPTDFAPALLSNPPRIVVGQQTDRPVAAAARQLDRLRGRPRVWVLFTHIGYDQGEQEYAAILRHLDRLGSRREQIAYPGAALLRYDLRRGT